MFSTWSGVVAFIVVVIIASAVYEVAKAIKTKQWGDTWKQPIVTGVVSAIGATIIKLCI